MSAQYITHRCRCEEGKRRGRRAEKGLELLPREEGDHGGDTKTDEDP